jgi:hypothetical protein
MDNKQLKFSPIKRVERSPELIANFVEGFADGWYIALKESFKKELDIKLTGINRIWTQGPYFCFSEGQVFYDSREGYNCWREALKKVNVACQIIAATPNTRVIEGSVQIVMFKPDEERTTLFPYVGYNLSQDNFVDFLKTGKL